jgi:glycosyltransferase involved in cell wall biosynthesis
MACGAAVITSDLSALPEVAGEAAHFVDPYKAEAIREAIIELLENDALRNELRERALARAKDFSWTRVAQQTLEVYRKLAS